MASGVGQTSAGRGQLSMSNSNHFYGTNSSGSKNHSSNWPLISQPQAPLQSHLTWSNSFNATLSSVPSMNSTSNTSTAIHNSVWSSNAYGGTLVSHSKRPPISNATNANVAGAGTGKKAIYANENQAMLGAHANTALSPSKYRRNVAVSNFKSYTNNITGPSSLYELGSAGSDNTSSSSDSANLRENGLLQLQVSGSLQGCCKLLSRPISLT